MIEKYIRKIAIYMKSINMRRNLKNSNFTIISNNCWGGFLHKQLDIPYNTPFVGLFLYAPDYIKLLENLEYYLGCDLEFIKESKYSRSDNKIYPIGKLDDIEIHFMHYKDKTDALEKWNRRVKRINYNNLFIKFSDRDLCNYEYINRFDQLGFKNKVFFSSKQYESIESCIFFKRFKNENCVDNEWVYYFDYFNVIEWLNNPK